MEVITDTTVQMMPEARVLHVVIDNAEADQALVEDVIAEVRGQAMYLDLYLYADVQAIAWHGWIAHAVLDYNGTLIIDQTNDPAARRALYEALH